MSQPRSCARLERLVVAWLVGDSSLMFASLSKESRGRTYATHLEMLTWPLCMSLMLLYFWHIDSSAVGHMQSIWELFGCTRLYL